MPHLNVEIKAKCADHDRIRRALAAGNADFHGKDFQTDTYFKTAFGRLKLREGTIENCLVFYERADKKGPKESKVVLYETRPGGPLKEMLARSLGVLVTVEKEREIYFSGNVKIHLDFVRGLGSFVEVEAVDRDGRVGKDRLYAECRQYLELFEIAEADLVEKSYSDMLLQKQ